MARSLAALMKGSRPSLKAGLSIRQAVNMITQNPARIMGFANKGSLEMQKMVSEVIKIQSFDSYTIKGNLTLPDGNNEVTKLVIYIDGAGPKTYRINYFPEYYANNGIAFFSFNKRGVYEDENTSSIKEIKIDEYKTYLPIKEGMSDTVHISWLYSYYDLRKHRRFMPLYRFGLSRANWVFDKKRSGI
jgi:hypothetical protein